MKEDAGSGKNALHEAQEALRQSEARYRRIVELANEGIMDLDENFRISYLNHNMTEMLGYPAGELLGRPYEDLVPEEDREVTEARKERRRRGQGEKFERRLRCKDGTVKWFQVSASAEVDEQNRFRATIGMFTDITERKQAEEALRKSEEKYRELVENANSIILRRDRDGRITYFNEFAQKFFGYSRDEILGRNVVGTFVPPSDQAGRDLARMIQDITLHPERYANNQNENMRRDGERVWISWTNRPVYDKSGRVVEILAVGNDITERKRAETELVQEKERFKSLTENAPFGMVMIDREGGFKYVNPKFTEILGYGLADVPNGKTWFRKAFPGPRDRHKAIAAWVRDLEASKPGEKRPAIFTVDCKDGAKKVINFIPVQLGTGENLMTCEDITERRRAEEESRKLNRQLRALTARLQDTREEERTAISREIHDELGQSLTALKMDISWLTRQMPEGPGTWAQRAKAMARLIDATIDTVRKISAELRPGMLDDLGLKAAMEWQLEQFQARTGINCKFTSNREEFPLSREKRTAVFRVFQETLTNVARHAKTRRVEVGLNDQDGSLILKVRDYGKGIPRGKVSSRRSLGILGMKERALLLGGEFQIRGTPGKGTTVTVKVPSRGKPGGKV